MFSLSFWVLSFSLVGFGANPVVNTTHCILPSELRQHSLMAPLPHLDVESYPSDSPALKRTLRIEIIRVTARAYNEVKVMLLDYS